MATKIYVITHKMFTKPEGEFFIPIQAGRAGNDELPFIGDNTGDNISFKNSSYCELTGLYWIWKNSDFTGNIGICHYRRYFVNKYFKFLTDEDCDRILRDYDIIIPKKYVDKELQNVFCAYARYHNGQDILKVGDIIKELYPDDYLAFVKVISDKGCATCNMMIMKRELYDEYCEWLFSILDRLEKEIDINIYNSYNKRVFGFLAERLLNVFIYARHLKSYESDIIEMMDEQASKEIISHIRKCYDNEMYIEGGKFAGDYIQSCISNGRSIFDYNMTLLGSFYMMNLLAFDKLETSKFLYRYSTDFEKLCNIVANIATFITMSADSTIPANGQKIINEMGKKLLLQFTELVLSDDKDKVRAFVNIAMSNYTYGNSVCIIPYFECALAIDEHDVYALTNLIKILHAYGEDKTAEKYEKMLK